MNALLRRVQSSCRVSVLTSALLCLALAAATPALAGGGGSGGSGSGGGSDQLENIAKATQGKKKHFGKVKRRRWHRKRARSRRRTFTPAIAPWGDLAALIPNLRMIGGNAVVTRSRDVRTGIVTVIIETKGRKWIRQFIGQQPIATPPYAGGAEGGLMNAIPRLISLPQRLTEDQLWGRQLVAIPLITIPERDLKHPRVLIWHFPQGEGGPLNYVKIFNPATGREQVMVTRADGLLLTFPETSFGGPRYQIADPDNPGRMLPQPLQIHRSDLLRRPDLTRHDPAYFYRGYQDPNYHTLIYHTQISGPLTIKRTILDNVVIQVDIFQITNETSQSNAAPAPDLALTLALGPDSTSTNATPYQAGFVLPNGAKGLSILEMIDGKQYMVTRIGNRIVEKLAL